MMGKVTPVLLGRLGGIRVLVNPYFLLVTAGFALAGRLNEAAGVFGVVVLHEIAHMVAASALGYRIAEVELLPFGGVARYDDLLEIHPVAEAATAAAGPAFSLASYLVLRTTQYSAWLGPHWLELLTSTSLAVACVNLLPALPLDGGHLLRALLVSQLGYRQGTTLALRLSRLVAVLLLAGGVWAVYKGYASSLSLLLGAFVLLAVVRQDEHASYVFYRYLTRKRRELSANGLLEASPLAVLPETPLRTVARRSVPNRFQVLFVVDDDGRLLKILTEMHVIEALFELGPAGRIEHLLSR